jgi:hypothetical protein
VLDLRPPVAACSTLKDRVLPSSSSLTSIGCVSHFCSHFFGAESS